MFPNLNGMKLEGTKTPKTWRLNNMLLIDQCVNEKEKFKKCMEINEKTVA